MSPSKCIRPLAQYCEVTVIHEESVAAPAGQLAGDPQIDEQGHCRRRRRKRELRDLAYVVHRTDRARLDSLVDPECRTGTPSGLFDLRAIDAKHLPKPLSRRNGTFGYLSHAFQEEVEPNLPAPVATYTIDYLTFDTSKMFPLFIERVL